jgi:hypothetical protein
MEAPLRAGEEKLVDWRVDWAHKVMGSKSRRVNAFFIFGWVK